MTSFDVLVMAAGKGTRMRSEMPKILHPICGRPMVLWPVAAARAAGASRVIVVRSPPIELAGILPDGVTEVVQPVADGTAGAVAAALPTLAVSQSPIVVVSGDVPLVTAAAIRELVDVHNSGGAAVTMLTSRLEDPTGYGRVIRSADGAVERVVETKVVGDATAAEMAVDEVNTGIFCFDAEALRAALPQVGSSNAQNERYLPDVLTIIGGTGGRVAAHASDDPALLLGINDRVALAAVTAHAQRRILERHMLAGVTVIDPGSVTVDVEVEIGSDTLLEPGTNLRGQTVVAGGGTTLGPQTTIIDSAIGLGCTVRHSYLDRASLEDGAVVGPFAYLRPGTVLRAGAKVGTFVEVKNSDVGAAAKVPHLSYVGDADIGPGANLGAATITANYNGKTKEKSRTTIGAEVRTGVDTTLVAPVALGDGSYTAAGSVITDDVPDAALAVARSRQRTIAGYADGR